MDEVCVITGGGSGIGLATAKQMPKNKILVITGRRKAKLLNAQEELEQLGYKVYLKTCDVSERDQVRELAEFAQLLGRITNVIHVAGISPQMGNVDAIARINSLGTVYMNEEFRKVMHDGSVIVDVSSNSAYILPNWLPLNWLFHCAENDEDKFVNRIKKVSGMLKNPYERNGLAYALSKKFVIWYAEKCAFEYGRDGIRVVSVSPGLIDTDMGNLEVEEGSDLLQFTCENRMGTADELGYAIASIANEKNGYLAGVDILCDGGSVNGKKYHLVTEKTRFKEEIA